VLQRVLQYMLQHVLQHVLQCMSFLVLFELVKVEAVSVLQCVLNCV